MIPITLSISGFLSYRDLVEIDFTTFELACVAGANGSGKSSLLDAITWVLFGEARKRDDTLINAQSKEAKVSLTFAYEGNIYRVQRLKVRDKAAILEFQIGQTDGVPGVNDLVVGATVVMGSPVPKSWKPLSERTLRETQDRIQSTLRMDYEMFINASFFLQGKADQFTQQRPGDRKRILGSILGLEIWETYRARAAERRKGVEDEIGGLDGRLHEIAQELNEEQTRRENLERLEAELKRLQDQRSGLESILESIRKISAALAARRSLVETLLRQAEALERTAAETSQRLALRTAEQESFNALLAKAPAIEAGFAGWQSCRAELEKWDAVAERFREQEKRREAPRLDIQTARTRLETERESLQNQARKVEQTEPEYLSLRATLEDLKAQLVAAETRLENRGELEASQEERRQKLADALGENKQLWNAMEELKGRIQRLKSMVSAECPFCGQPLNPEDRQALIGKTEAEGKEMGDRYRENKAQAAVYEEEVRSMQDAITALRSVEADLRALHARQSQSDSRLELIDQQRSEWVEKGKPRLDEINLALSQESYALEARRTLAEIDAGLKEIGYDAETHDLIRKQEVNGRSFDDEKRKLERAQAALAPLQREIADLQTQVANQAAEAQRQRAEHTQAAVELAADEAQAPDLLQSEKQLYQAREQENRLRMEVGAARQKVMVLDDLKARRTTLQAQREENAIQVGHLKQLERAFGKDGVPALLIEQALPEIESRANEVLDRLSDGVMTVRFVTQSAYKEKNRTDMRETLDIQISDGMGRRDYELYSGGEAFRVNFAVRLALSEVLAQRAGARLQTLVIDEGFGSQDAHGRQRLVEAINLVRTDFAKILVITHIDELKEAFSTRLEVEKTDSGSRVKVVNY